MPFSASVFQPVPAPSASVPGPPFNAAGKVLAALFWRLVSLS